MIPAKFDYTKPRTLDEAVTALAGAGDDGKVIAGGQSLMPLLRLRLAYPDLLVDVGGLDELRGVTDGGDTLEIGAGTTIYELTRDPLVRQHAGLLAQAALQGQSWFAASGDYGAYDSINSLPLVPSPGEPQTYNGVLKQGLASTSQVIYVDSFAWLDQMLASCCR